MTVTIDPQTEDFTIVLTQYEWAFLPSGEDEDFTKLEPGEVAMLRLLFSAMDAAFNAAADAGVI